ncbi:NitT/TauT family transport system permease protein [Methanolobus vulcani]|jgi:NitT/TauT family transport system permease protein|uniref:NitT/TauT family transport system permease protein n=1 Tax=Methanolobus vulcani TaxID=38026 RepID=A0A7Z7AVB6_9EURY|nr:ABC transporter permease [Methanolobus vulcani]MDK2826376.1 sulfonate transport system permease protein [Methanolobus sp.]MDK2948067.1 sulfonate transport system permease protein [Methanolobus sp.]SDF54286.1 NitT/TauT family transport system permease protein [Methanolobus vulcani]
MVKKHIQALKEKSVEIVSIFSAIVLWQIIAVYVVGNKFYLPSFTDVAGALVEIISRDSSLAIMGLNLQLPMLVVDFLYSMMHFSIGLIAALVIGIPIGMIMGWFRTIDRIADPIVEIIRPIPPLAWIPFAIIWIGLNPFAAGFLIFIGAVFPIMINTFTGFKSVSRVYVEAAKVLGCNTNRELIRYVALPSALPSIAAGIRIAMGVGWMCLVAAEMFGVSRNGLGYQMWHFYDLHRMEFVLVYMLILGFLGLFIDRLLRYYIDGKLLKWRKGVVI